MRMLENLYLGIMSVHLCLLPDTEVGDNYFRRCSNILISRSGISERGYDGSICLTFRLKSISQERK